MKLLLLIIPFLVTASAQITDVKDCKCPKGSYAKLEGTNGFKCYGVILSVILPCNTPIRPDCECSSPNGDSILHDTGTVCSHSDAEGKIKQWECENKEEWASFFKDYPEEKIKYE